MPKKQRIIIIAGPNGAGKTTFAREYLLKEAHCPAFINVDLIAAGLSPFDPERAAIQAGRLMLSEIQRRVRKRESFAFETTLSGHVYARMIPEWRSLGLSREAHISRLTNFGRGHPASSNTSCARRSRCEQPCRSAPLRNGFAQL